MRISGFNNVVISITLIYRIDSERALAKFKSLELLLAFLKVENLSLWDKDV